MSDEFLPPKIDPNLDAMDVPVETAPAEAIRRIRAKPENYTACLVILARFDDHGRIQMCTYNKAGVTQEQELVMLEIHKSFILDGWRVKEDPADGEEWKKSP